MRTLLAISPHLDDAIFSAGSTIARASRRGWRTVIATVFTGNVSQPKGFALACQLDKGLGPDVDYMALRREEDLAACALVGAEAIHLPYLEAPHRGYEDAPALFGAVHADDEAITTVARGLADLIAAVSPTRILAPFGLGGHVDHLIVRDAVHLAAAARAVYLWEDWPYLERVAAHNRTAARFVRSDAELQAVKLAACAAYETQLGFQFGGKPQLAELLSKQSGERFHRDTRLSNGRMP